MKYLNFKKNWIKYVLFFIWGLAVWYFSHFMVLTPWIFTLSFLFVFLMPGFLINQVFRIEDRKNWFSRLVLWIAFGMIWNFTIMFLAMLFGWRLQELVWIYLAATLSLFLVAVFSEIFFKEIEKEKAGLLIAENEVVKPWRQDLSKKIFKWENLVYALVFLFVGAIILTVDEQGANFKGDPYYHLTIIRKVVEGQPLSPENLNFTKTSQINPVYGLPVWHIFLGMLSSLFETNIFTVWGEAGVSLTIMVFIVWYWLARKIMPNRLTAILAFILFIVFTYQYNNGYFFARLAVPDTLGQLLLLPLAISLAIEYIFDREGDWRLLLFLSILLLSIAAIHFTQYFYFLIIMVFFAIIYTVIYWKDAEYKKVITKIILTFSTSLIMASPLIIFLEVKSKTVSAVMTFFLSKDPDKIKLSHRLFSGAEALAKYAYIATPLILVFIRRYRRLIFLFTMFLVVPIAYSQSIGFIRYWLIKVFGEIAINRLYANVTWDFFVWGLFLSFGLVLFDRLISNKLNHPMVRRILNIVLIITGLAVVALETKWSLISTLHKNTIASVWLNSWLGVNYYWFLIPVIVLALVVLYQERRSAKWHQFFVFTPIKNYIPVLLAAFLVIFFLFSPNFKPFWHFLDIEFAQQYFMKPSRNHTGKLVTYSRIGGKEVVDFIKTNVPSKSVFLADKTATSVLPLVTDQYMAADIKSFGEQRYRRVYKDTMSHSVRLEEVVISNGDYLLLSNPNQKNSKYFDTHKNIYKKIYSGKHAAIYKINWPAANYEYQLMMQEKNAKAKIQTNL